MPRILLFILVFSMLSACGGSEGSGTHPDMDGDGVANEFDAFPQDARESVDTDGDGVGDNADIFPNNPEESLDTDSDGVGDNEDAFPRDSSEKHDLDGDGIGDNADLYPNDFDNDAVPDALDIFPTDPNESVDSDGDGVGDNSDAFPTRPSETLDSDGDGVGDNEEAEIRRLIALENSQLGLGFGVGEEYQAGKARTGLFENESLAPGGSTFIHVSVVNETNNNERFLGVRDVFFTSVCAQLGLAEFTPERFKISGIATATYLDKGCGGAYGQTDTIVVSLVSEDEEGNLFEIATATTEIDVDAETVGTIEVVNTIPSTIAINGFGTQQVPSLSRVDFRVLDILDKPMPDRVVSFEIEHELGNAALTIHSAVTNQEGVASVILNAGNVAGSVRIKGSVEVLDWDGNTVRTESVITPYIVVATPLARPNGIILSADTYNPHAWDYTGTEVVITAQVSDNNQNPVMDGTQIHFSETAGLVDSHCETLQGSCSVTWRSVNPNTVDGYATIMAQARGQGNFQDRNSNGLFDIGESFQAYGEAWFDANGNGVYESEGRYQADLDIDNDGINEFDWNPEGYQVYVNADGDYTEAPNNFYEEMVDTNNNGELDSIPDAKYQGINCSDAAIADDHCAELIDVTASLRLQMSAGNDVYIEGPFLKAENGEYDYSQTVNCIDGQTNSHQVAWRVSDSQERRNHLPVGAVISYVGSSAAVISENGFGEVQSLQPPLVLPVWEVQAANIGLTGSERKHKYLNEKAHLVELRVSKPESVDPESTHGTFTLNVRPMDESIHVGFNQMLTIGYGSDYCAFPVLELEL